ncbi:MAG: hypothetical protein K0S74_1518 [Chlamydiales bacterium]|nr:hypothetical protein [Chlamydiales bacterium]
MLFIYNDDTIEKPAHIYDNFVPKFSTDPFYKNLEKIDNILDYHANQIAFSNQKDI